MNENINEILEQRAKTHGDFKDHALLAQALKDCFYANRVTKTLTYSQKEAIDMVFHKIARIGAGNPNEIDHWRDIAGYALLVVRELEREYDDCDKI